MFKRPSFRAAFHLVPFFIYTIYVVGLSSPDSYVFAGFSDIHDMPFQNCQPEKAGYLEIANRKMGSLFKFANRTAYAQLENLYSPSPKSIPLPVKGAFHWQ